MPLRTFNREQTWLLPPSLDELIPRNHPARFVAAFVDSLERAIWVDMGIELEGESMGAPAYHPRALLSVWLYGFMTGTRSSRKLEAACRDQLPYLWLTGWQCPDHNTLWRFYQEYRDKMKSLFKQTVCTAVKIGLVDLAIQAVDGTKIMGNVSKDRVYDGKRLQQLLEKTEAAIANLEAQNEKGNDPATPYLPKQFEQKQKLKQKIKNAMQQLAESNRKNINLTDGDTRLMKGRQGIVSGYNLQAVVAPLKNKEDSGHLIITAEVVVDQNDRSQLASMLQKSEEVCGRRPEIFIADAGYNSSASIQKCAELKQTVVMPVSQQQLRTQPYHKDNFTYDESNDSYICPAGHRLRFAGFKNKHKQKKRLYRATKAVCRDCSAFGICTRDSRQGRALEIGQHEKVMQLHSEWMKTNEAQLFMKRRKGLSEPVFGILKEQQSARKFLLRGIANVRAEAKLLATAFNLRTLHQKWLKSEVSKMRDLLFNSVCKILTTSKILFNPAQCNL